MEMLSDNCQGVPIALHGHKGGPTCVMRSDKPHNHLGHVSNPFIMVLYFMWWAGYVQMASLAVSWSRLLDAEEPPPGSSLTPLLMRLLEHFSHDCAVRWAGYAQMDSLALSWSKLCIAIDDQ
jgi:hypothetical protein